MIRQATLNDIDALSKLFEAYRVFYKQDSDQDEVKFFLKKRLELNESTIFVKVVNDEIIGFTQLYPSFSSVSMKPTWILNDLYVCKKHRAKGYGQELLNEAKRVGREIGLKSLSLQTGKDNLSAQELYRKDGWIFEEEYISFNFRL